MVQENEDNGGTKTDASDPAKDAEQANPPVPVGINNTTVTPYSQQNPKQKQETRRYWAKTILEIAALIGLGIYTAINGCQLSEQRHALVNSTQTQININLPLILPSSLDLNPINTEDGAPVIRVRQAWSNIGETRAVGPTISWGWSEDEPTGTPAYQRHLNGWSKTTWIKGLPPAADELDITLAEFQRIIDKKRPIFTFGAIRYMDAFPEHGTDDRRDHLVKYCVKLIGLTIAKPVGSRMFPCENINNNCYDTNCPISDYPR